MIKIENGVEIEMTPEEIAEFEASQTQEAEPHVPVYRIFKSVFIRRLTSAEAETMEAVLAGADAKLRLMFNSVEYFVSDDPLFETLMAAVGLALGEARAGELLASEA